MPTLQEFAKRVEISRNLALCGCALSLAGSVLYALLAPVPEIPERPVVLTGIPVVDLSALPSDSLELLKSRALISANPLAAARGAAVPLNKNTTNPYHQ